jgi:hypothetical protein
MLVTIKIRAASETRVGFTVVANIAGKRAVASAHTTNPVLVGKHPRKDDRFSVELPETAMVIDPKPIPDTDGLFGMTLQPKSIDWASLADFMPGVEQ